MGAEGLSVVATDSLKPHSSSAQGESLCTATRCAYYNSVCSSWNAMVTELEQAVKAGSVVTKLDQSHIQ